MKKMIMLIAVLLVMCVSFTSCKNDTEKAAEEQKENLKIGMVLVGDDAYTKSHLDGINKMIEEFSIDDDKVLTKTKITQEDCYKTITDLVKNQKCNIVFVAGEKTEDHAVQAATENPKVEFCFANGMQAATAGLANYHNYSINESESRYMSGVVAGLKIKDMADNGEIPNVNIKIGYVGSVANVANKSAYTAFYLGVKSICPDVTMEVQYSGLEHSEKLEEIAAKALIANGCAMIAHHSYINGAAKVCEENNIYFIGNIDSKTDNAPNFALTSQSLDWKENYVYAINRVLNGKKLPKEWSCGVEKDSCGITEINQKAFTSADVCEKANKKIESIKKQLKDKSLYVFDINKWTVEGKKISSTADEKFESDYYGKEFIKDGYFREYELYSYPCFAFDIDGITELNG